MVKTVYANGCSWTAGDGLESDPNFPTSTSARLRAMMTLTWPAVLAKTLKAACINKAMGGGSNHRMVRMTTDYVRRLSEEERKETLVVLGWTSSERNEVFLTYDGVEAWCRLNAWQPFGTHWKRRNNPWPDHVIKDMDKYQEITVKYLLSERNCIENMMREIYLMANLLENLGIKFLFFSSINGMTFPGSETNIESKFPREIKYLEDPRFMGMHRGDSMLSWCHQNQIPLSPCVHPMIEGHKKWAEHLHNHYLTIYQSSKGDPK